MANYTIRARFELSVPESLNPHEEHFDSSHTIYGKTYMQLNDSAEQFVEAGSYANLGMLHLDYVDSSGVSHYDLIQSWNEPTLKEVPNQMVMDLAWHVKQILTNRYGQYPEDSA